MTYPNGPQQPGTPVYPATAAVQPSPMGYPAPQAYPAAPPMPPAQGYAAPYGAAPAYGYGFAPVYGAPGYGAGLGYGAPGYGLVDPYTGEALSDKSKTTAGLLQFFLGGFGAGRFYLGYNGIACAQLVLTVGGWFLLFIGMFLVLPLLFAFPMLIGGGIWVFVDAIMMFTGSVRDPHGRKLSS